MLYENTTFTWKQTHGKKSQKHWYFLCFMLCSCWTLSVKCLPSGPPSSPKVHCWCSSYPNMTLCSWPEPPHFPPGGYIATYRYIKTNWRLLVNPNPFVTEELMFMCVNVFVSERHRDSVAQQCDLIQPGSPSPFLTSASSSSSERVTVLFFSFAADTLFCITSWREVFQNSLNLIDWF